MILLQLIHNTQNYLKNKEEAKTVTHGSATKFDIVCPICKHEKKMKLADLTRHGFSCPKCGDKISYPNRFMTNLLSMLNVEYDSEKNILLVSNKKI